MVRQKKYRKNNPLKVKARRKVHSEIKKGNIIIPNRCEGCKAKSDKLHFHHVNYSQYINGKWYCRTCEIDADTKKNAVRALKQKRENNRVIKINNKLIQ